MYLEYYGLKAQPFQITCDPKFFWLGEKHKEALAMLRYGIEDNRGFLLLTGGVGTGKTLLVNQLMTLFSEKTIVANLSGPKLGCTDFYLMLANRFNMPHTFKTKAEFLIQFRDYLYAKAAEGRQVVLIIDEAQTIGSHTLEDIRLLSNIELPEKKLLNIFLVGQQELNQLLITPENRAFAQRITLRYHLEPLSITETAAYIEHRLRVAGSDKMLFTSGATEKIFKYAAGIPRLINILCDHVLLTGSVYEREEFDETIIDECARELRIPKQLSSPCQDQLPIQSFDRQGRAGITSEATFKRDQVDGKAKGAIAARKVDRSADNSPYGRWVFAGISFCLVLALTIALIYLDGGSNPLAYTKDTNSDGDKQSVASRTDSPLRRDGTQGAAGTLDWSAKENILIHFSAANKVTGQSLPTMDELARWMIAFPEQVVYLYVGVEGPLKQRQEIRRQRLDEVKSMLVGKGAYAYQVKCADADWDAKAIEAKFGATPDNCAVISFQSEDGGSSPNYDK